MLKTRYAILFLGQKQVATTGSDGKWPVPSLPWLAPVPHSCQQQDGASTGSQGWLPLRKRPACWPHWDSKPRRRANRLVSPVVGWLGLEPRTNGLKGRCSTD